MAVHAGRALFEQGIGDRRGNAQRGVLVWVYLRGTSTLATLYTDRTKATEQDNPLSTNGLGNLAIFADPGDYEAHVDSTGAVLEFTVLPDWEDVVTGDEPEGGLPAHLSDAVGAHNASAVSFTPTGSIAATNTQAAVVEVAAAAAALVTAEAAARVAEDSALTTALAGKEPTIPPGTYVPADPELSIAYDADGNPETVTEDGIVTTYTFNADGTVATSTRLGVTRTYTYDDGLLTAVA